MEACWCLFGSGFCPQFSSILLLTCRLQGGPSSRVHTLYSGPLEQYQYHWSWSSVCSRGDGPPCIFGLLNILERRHSRLLRICKARLTCLFVSVMIQLVDGVFVLVAAGQNGHCHFFQVLAPSWRPSSRMTRPRRRGGATFWGISR